MMVLYGTNKITVMYILKRCASTNTTFLSLDNICIHSDHSGVCGTHGKDMMDVILKVLALGEKRSFTIGNMMIFVEMNDDVLYKTEPGGVRFAMLREPKDLRGIPLVRLVQIAVSTTTDPHHESISGDVSLKDCLGFRCGNSTKSGEPCCWLKSAIGPAHLWSNDNYCTAAGVVFIPGPL